MSPDTVPGVDEIRARRKRRLERARALQGSRAGFVSRTAANAIDAIVVVAIELGVYLLVAVVRYLITRDFFFPRPHRWVNFLAYWGIAVAYMSSGWSATGKTIGKQLVGLRVVRASGEPLGPGHAFLRALAYAVFLPGFLLILISRRNLSVQDYLVGSAVVYDWAYRALGV